MEHLRRVKRAGRQGFRLLAVLGWMATGAAVWAADDARSSNGDAERVAPSEAAVERMAASASAAPASGSPGAAGSSWAYDLAGELMSPFCPGRTLASCPSPQAGELIQWIAMQEAAGASREDVIALLVERHGEEILGAPPARGITLWAYVLPVLGFVAFGGVAALALRRIVASGGRAPGGAPVIEAAAGPVPETSVRPAVPGPASDELARIVDAELAERA